MKKLFIIAGVVLIALLSYGIWLYNKPHKEVNVSSVTASMSATDLFEAFSSDESSAMEMYSDKVLEISGSFSHTDFSNEAEPQILIQVADNQGYIRCGFAPESLEIVQNLTSDQNIKFIGICQGFNNTEGLDLLSDPEVVLSECTIIE